MKMLAMYPTMDNTALIALLTEAAVNPTKLLGKKQNCLIEAEKYRIDKAVQILVEQIEDE